VVVGAKTPHLLLLEAPMEAVEVLQLAAKETQTRRIRPRN